MKKFLIPLISFSFLLCLMGNAHALSLDSITNISNFTHYESRRSMSVGDVDNDGELDLVGESSGQQFAVTFSIDGTPSYANQNHLAAVQFGYYASDLVDLDGDGDLDFISGGANGSSTSPNFVYYWDGATNNRYEYLTSAYSIGNEGLYSVSLVTGDFVEDGKPDIIWFEYDTAYLATNTSTGIDSNISFTGLTTTTLGIGNVPFGNQSSDTGDFNGDGDLDFVIADDNSGGGGFYSVGLGDGAGNFTVENGPSNGDGYRAYAVKTGDFNDDGKDDFLLARNNYSSTDATLYLFTRNATNDGFDQSTVKSTTSYTYRYIETGTLDFDDKDDFVLLDSSNNIDIHLNNGDGTFDATPDETVSSSSSYQLWFLDINGDSKNDIVRTASSGNGLSYFPQTTVGRTLTYTAGSGGSLTGSTSQVVADGGDGTAVTAVPNSGYRFVNWSDSSTDNPRTDTSVSADISVTANFALKTYSLTYSAGEGGSISGTKSQTVNHGANGSAVTAVPADGYAFSSWSDGSTTNPRTDTNVTASKSVTAQFVATSSGGGSSNQGTGNVLPPIVLTPIPVEDGDDVSDEDSSKTEEEQSMRGTFTSEVTWVGTTSFVSELRIRVIDSRGKPIAGIQLSLSSDTQYATTDTNGYAVFNDVQTNMEHTLAFDYDGQAYEKSVQIEEPNAESTKVVLDVVEVIVKDIEDVSVADVSEEVKKNESSGSNGFLIFVSAFGLATLGAIVWFIVYWQRKKEENSPPSSQ